MTTTTNLRWCKTKCEGTSCDGGSRGTYQKRAYALAVTVALMGAPVCHCGTPVSLFDGEVDRTAPGCYRPGFVLMTCHGCNNDRTHVATFDSAALAADVLRVSLTVPIPAASEAAKAWKAGREVGATLRRSRYYRGE